MDLYDILYIEITYYSERYSDIIIKDATNNIQVLKTFQDKTKEELKKFADKHDIIFNDFENNVTYNEWSDKYDV